MKACRFIIFSLCCLCFVSSVLYAVPVLNDIVDISHLVYITEK